MGPGSNVRILKVDDYAGRLIDTAEGAPGWAQAAAEAQDPGSGGEAFS